MPAHNNASHGLSYCSEPPRHPRTERHARQKLHAHAHQAPSCMCTKQLGHLSGLESPFVAWITKKRPQARATDRRTDRGAGAWAGASDTQGLHADFVQRQHSSAIPDKAPQQQVCACVMSLDPCPHAWAAAAPTRRQTHLPPPKSQSIHSAAL
eukprot:1159455-Pelagomonas_calceolata.AAC.3